MKILFTTILIFSFLTGKGQPGSYRTDIKITIFDLPLSNYKKAKYTISFSDKYINENIEPLNYKFRISDSCLIFSSVYPWIGCHPILQILKTNPNEQTDTMSIKLLLKSQYGSVWAVDSMPFKKGGFILTNSMFKADDNRNIDVSYITNWERASQQIDKNSNLIITDYWNWNDGPKKSQKKIIGLDKAQMIEWYEENGAVAKVLNYKNDQLYGSQTYYHPNGQIHFHETVKNGCYVDQEIICYNKEGNVYKKIITKQNSIIMTLVPDSKGNFVEEEK